MIEKVISTALENDPELKRLLGERIRPFMLPENDVLPAGIFIYGNETGESGKDGGDLRKLPLIISVGSNDIGLTTQLTWSVKKAVKTMTGQHGGVCVSKTSLGDVQRDYDAKEKVFFNTIEHTIYYQELNEFN